MSENDDFDPPIALIPNDALLNAIPEGQIPRIALSDAAFYTLIQENIDIDGYNLAIIALKKMLVLVLDGTFTYKGQFQREIENRSIPYTLDIQLLNSLDLNYIKNVQALIKARINRLPYTTTNEQLITQV